MSKRKPSVALKKYELQNHLGWKSPSNSMFLWYVGARRLEEGFPSGDRRGLTISTPLYCLSARAVWSFFSLPITMEFILVFIVICRKCSGHICSAKILYYYLSSRLQNKMSFLLAQHCCIRAAGRLQLKPSTKFLRCSMDRKSNVEAGEDAHR